MTLLFYGCWIFSTQIWAAMVPPFGVDSACEQPPFDLSQGVPEVPEFHCLPPEISVDWQKERDYLEYETQLTAGERVPLFSGSLIVEGKDERSRAEVKRRFDQQLNQLEEEEKSQATTDQPNEKEKLRTVQARLTDWYISKFFVEKHYAWLPKGQSIHVLGARSPVWEYPTGTTLWHEIHWQSADGPIFFELRVLVRLRNGIWAYGAYRPGRYDKGRVLRTLKLRTDAGVTLDPTSKSEGGHSHDGVGGKVEKFLAYVLASDGREESYFLSFQRQSTRGCRTCHMNHGGVESMWGIGQPENLRSSYAGPCGMNPSNSHLKSWIDRFLEVRHDSPFKSVRQ